MRENNLKIWGLPIIISIINLTIGTWSVAEILSWFGKDIPILADGAIGLIVGEISIPIALVGWILRYFSVF
ncbi:hypothetical protein [Clostridium senegalense]